MVVLKPTTKIDQNYSLVLPHQNQMKSIKLNRQYRSSVYIHAMIEIMSFIFEKTDTFVTLLPEVRSAQMGHEVPGDIVEWYALKGDARS